MPQPFHVSGAAVGPLLGWNRPGVNLVRDIFEKSLRFIDPSQAEHALTVMNLATFVVPNLIDVFYSLRHYTRVFFTSAVTIKASDELYLQVFNWLAKRESQSRFIKEYTARTLSDSRLVSSSRPEARSLAHLRAMAPEESSSAELSYIKLTPAFKTTWFFYHWNLFAVLRNENHSSTYDPPSHAIPISDYFGPMATGKEGESLTITCLGWSATPIRALLKSCRKMAMAQRQTSVTIRGCRDDHWRVMAVKPVRPLETIAIDKNVKENLIGDIKKYLNPRRRLFYSENGIPYRRGYLLHGPPGCGKSSLSLALAGFFGLDMYIVNLASVYEYELEALFATLPARCFVLLEDIDAVGFRRKDGDTDTGRRGGPGSSRQRCSLSSLLNVLDGVASHCALLRSRTNLGGGEGRVVIMTSNFPDRLDDALVRPGRIDMKVHMGYITRQGAEHIFLRMMKTGRLDKTNAGLLNDGEHTGKEHTENEHKASGYIEDDRKVHQHQIDEELQVLAQKFAQNIPEDTFTPAQLQGYLLRYLHSATSAVDKFADWVADEKRKLAGEALRNGCLPPSQ
ncbi:hypothetical protein E0Z10_g9809 [Xylaria hypoxylon]|uniref:AAA+ ATPase domain-containing protein n=1 Tax=Xylaria hypoxylon TaxID=37992 RepID=A0A4Z0YMR4_9PEZI|nr:hypothetical protein E0Z10_g9809 [Xylaria hypoxylon]